MRPIEFRAKRIDNGEWVYGHGITQKPVVQIICEKVGTLDFHYEVDPATVGQFTGLHDKNGNKIWEGDILSVDCSPVGGSFDDGTYKVEYVLPDCAFCLIKLDEKGAIGFSECYLYEIIGNIHENQQP